MAVVGPVEILDRVATFLAAGHSEWRWADDLFPSTADGADRFHFSGGERSADCCWDDLMRFMPATIAAAVLARLELAADAEEALSRIRAVRQFALPSREQKAALLRCLASARLDRSIPNLSRTEKL
jgi:hypothetical protein